MYLVYLIKNCCVTDHAHPLPLTCGVFGTPLPFGFTLFMDVPYGDRDEEIGETKNLRSPKRDCFVRFDDISKSTILPPPSYKTRFWLFPRACFGVFILSFRIPV